ncbi:hypothetical protein wTpre_537 [Wolbachia endosymbiont of Trichogramma pretiosum]|nr:hypothetical protein wTpre_537 [Wolbachia endosymbiont of Trichogramma pretiosum]
MKYEEGKVSLAIFLRSRRTTKQMIRICLMLLLSIFRNFAKNLDFTFLRENLSLIWIRHLEN